MGVIPGQPVEMFTVSVTVGGRTTVEGVETSATAAKEKADKIKADLRAKLGGEAAISSEIKRFNVDVK